jgi:hypothetical protein
MSKSSAGRKPQERNRKTEEGIGKQAPSGWERFGWQGVTGRVPPEWNIGAIGGDYVQGYLRLDEAEYPRLEVKWNKKTVDLSDFLERYLRSLGRRGPLKARIRGMEVNREVKIVSHRAKPSKEILGFSWQDDKGLKGAGIVWHCKVCGRTLFGQVRAYEREDAVSLAKEIFPALEDHGEEGRLLWALYGLEFHLPEEYRLAGQSLMAGYLELRFEKRRKRLRVSRWGLAAMLLARGGLAKWFKHNAAEAKSPLQWEARDRMVKDHAGLEIEGRSRRALARLGRGLRGLSKEAVGGGSDEVSEPDGLGLVWHCAESNRLHLVEAHNRPDRELVEEVADSIRCH